MIPVSTIVRKEIRQYLLACSTNRLIREVHLLTHDDLAVIFRRYWGVYPIWMFRECLLNIAETGCPATEFLLYAKTLKNFDHYIPGQFAIFYKRPRVSPRTEEFYKLRNGKFWRYYFKAARVRHNAYSVQGIVERLGVSVAQATQMVARRKNKTAGTWENFLRRADGNHQAAQRKFDKFRQRSAQTKDKYVQRYGLQNGTRKWNALCASRNSYDLDKFVAKYGNQLGPIELARRVQRSTVDYNKYVEIYGVTEAPREYHRYCRSKTRYWRSRGWGIATKESMRLFGPLMRWLDRHDILYKIGSQGSIEKSLFDNILHKVYYYDFCVPEAKILIEFDGQTHPSPRLSEAQLACWRCFLSGVSAKTRLAEDTRKAVVARECGYCLIRVHVEQFDEDPQHWIHGIARVIKKRMEHTTCK